MEVKLLNFHDINTIVYHWNLFCEIIGHEEAQIALETDVYVVPDVINRLLLWQMTHFYMTIGGHSPSRISEHCGYELHSVLLQREGYEQFSNETFFRDYFKEVNAEEAHITAYNLHTGRRDDRRDIQGLGYGFADFAVSSISECSTRAMADSVDGQKTSAATSNDIGRKSLFILYFLTLGCL